MLICFYISGNIRRAFRKMQIQMIADTLIYATKLLLIKTGFFRDKSCLHLDVLDD